MRFIMLVKASPDSEAGLRPAPELFEAMGKFNAEMVQAGVMLDGGGLQPSSKGVRVRFSAAKPTVTDGPFTEATELVAGYWLIDVPSKAEAIQWASRVPFQDGEIEVRQVFEAADYPEEFVSASQRGRDQALRDELQRKGAHT